MDIGERKGDETNESHLTCSILNEIFLMRFMEAWKWLKFDINKRFWDYCEGIEKICLKNLKKFVIKFV